MSGVESALVAAGRAVVTGTVRAWLGERKHRRERSSDLVELLAPAVPDLLARRRVGRQFEEIADEVAARLDRAFGPDRLPENEKLSALAEVVDTLTAADLSDSALFAADADPAVLAHRLRQGSAARVRAAGLGEAGTAFYHRVLDDCAGVLVAMVRQLPAFEPRAMAETLARLSSLSGQIAEVLARLPRTSLDAPAGTDRDAEFERRYLDVLASELDRVELFGLSTHNYRPRLPLTVAYLSLSVSVEERPRPRRGRRDELLRGRPFFGDADRGDLPLDGVRVEAALGRGDRVFLRGEAGSGKTTLLHWLAVTAARRAFTGELAGWNGCVPFLVTLRRYTEGDLPRPERLLDQERAADMVAGLMPDAWSHRVLESGRALLLVDGVDELAGGQRARVRDWLRRLVSAYPRARVVVTSRPTAAAARWLQAEGFAPVTLDRMSRSDVTAFVTRWHQAAAQSGTQAGNLPCPPEELPRYQAALLRQFDANRHLRNLATNPLLAALICALNLGRHARIPQDRMGLYSAALELLLERRDAERQVPAGGDLPLDFRTRTELLAGLAWWLTENGRAEMSRDDAVRELASRLRMLPALDVDADAVLDHLLERSGVLREPVVGRIDFAHRTFGEYLAAREAAEHHRVGLLVNRAHRDQWHDIVVMAAGHGTARFREELLTGLLDRAEEGGRHARELRVLAATCLQTALSVPPELRGRIESTLDELVPPRRGREARSLAAGGEAVLHRLPKDLSGLSERSAAATVRVAALIDSPRSLDLLAGYATDPRERVQRELVEVWKYFDPDTYARTVLAHAPLDDGFVTITDRRLVPSLRHLRNLTALLLDISGETLTDLDWLADVPVLAHLAFRASGVVDLAPLRAHVDLRALSVEGGAPPRHLDVLTQLRGLVALRLYPGEPFSGLDFLRGLTNLETLRLDGLAKVRDFSPLATLTSLARLWVRGCVFPVSALAPLTRLELITFRQAFLDGGLLALAEAQPGLTDLTLWDCGDVENLGPLTRLTRLRGLNLAWCSRVDDLTPLRDLPNLDYLSLYGCRPGLDLSPLAGKAFSLILKKEQQVVGLDTLGPGVRVNWT